MFDTDPAGPPPLRNPAEVGAGEGLGTCTGPVRHRFPLAHHHSGNPPDVGAGEGLGSRRPGAGHASSRGVRGPARPRHRRLRHRLSGARPRAAARHRHQGVHAGGTGVAWRRGHGGAPLPHRRRRRDLRQGPRIVPRRSPAARELRSSGAGQGASLLAEQRHRLHGDAVLPGPDVEGRAPGDARGARRSLAEGADRAGARRARAAACARRLSPRHRARQHPRAARRPAGAARLRLRAPRRCRRLAVVHRPSQAAVRATGAVRRRRQRRPGAVDRPVLARRDAAFRRHRPRTDRLGGARRARHAAGPFVVAAAGDFARACSPPSTGPWPSRPTIGRGTSRRFDVRSAARSRRRHHGGCRSRPATRARAAALVAPAGAAPKREASQGEGVPLAAGRADRGVHWGAALSIAFAALAAVAALRGPSTLPEASPAATPPSVDPVATERVVVPERLADAMPAIVGVPAVSEASRGEAVEPSAASLGSISAPAPVAVAGEPHKPARSAKARLAKQPLPTAARPPRSAGAPAVATVRAC